ncbi:MAG: hypothetical protein IJ527_07250 [Prevotella sp.]|nr:hypothetical protein [Prevotella sp.]
MEIHEKREARLRLSQEFLNLMNLRPADGAQWTGSVADLVEAAHVVYECGTICDDSGSTISFKRLVSSVCLSLHVTAPSNPNRTLYQARNRKGTRQTCYFERYCRMMFDMNIEMPMQQCVRMED